MSDREEDESLSYVEIMQLGHEAAEALKAPIFRYANKIAIDQAIMDWVNTAPKEREKRESLWGEIQAHGRINDILRGTAGRAEQEALRQEERKRKHLDEQGFGLDDGYPLQ